MTTIHSIPSILNKPLNELIKPHITPGRPPMNNDELKKERQKDRNTKNRKTDRQTNLDFRSRIECRRKLANVEKGMKMIAKV